MLRDSTIVRRVHATNTSRDIASLARKHRNQPAILPATHLLENDSTTALMNSVVYFCNHDSIDPTALKERILEAISSYPMLCDRRGNIYDKVTNDQEELKRISTGELFLPRLLIIHHLLCGNADTRAIRVLDNGPGAFPHVALTLAQLGSQVTITEPDPTALRLLCQLLDDCLNPEIISRLTFMVDINGFNALFGKIRVSYWTNPSPRLTHLGYEQSSYIADDYEDYLMGNYLGKGVMPGGFVVVQADQSRFSPKQFDPSQWTTIIDTEVGNHETPGQILATQMACANRFFIMQRKI